MEVSLVRETHLTSEPTSSTLVVTATRSSPSTFSNALNESNPKTVAWLVTWKLISIGKPPPPLPSPSKFLSKLSTNFLGQLLHRDSVHRSIIPPLPQVSITRRRDNPVNFPSDALHRSPFSLPRRNRTDSIVRLLIRAALQKEALRAIHLTRTLSLVYLSITFYFLRSDK